MISYIQYANVTYFHCPHYVFCSSIPNKYNKTLLLLTLLVIKIYAHLEVQFNLTSWNSLNSLIQSNVNLAKTSVSFNNQIFPEGTITWIMYKNLWISWFSCFTKFFFYKKTHNEKVKPLYSTISSKWCSKTKNN